jgi:AraC family transcriptional regulator
LRTPILLSLTADSKTDQAGVSTTGYSGFVPRKGSATPVEKALWYIESHFSEEVTLDDVANVAGVSRYHMSRAFGLATNYPVMQYLRGRRLSEAARIIARGAPDILAVALDHGYGSHEAFTRAFRGQFGLTPEAIRAQGNLDNVELMEPITMDEAVMTQVEAPRFEEGRIMLIVGLGERCDSNMNIPALWQRFAPHIGHIPGQAGFTAYGVLCNADDSGNMDYIAGVEVSDFARVPAEFSRLRIPEQKYAVFQHRGHVSIARQTWTAMLEPVAARVWVQGSRRTGVRTIHVILQPGDRRRRIRDMDSSEEMKRSRRSRLSSTGSGRRSWSTGSRDALGISARIAWPSHSYTSGAMKRANSTARTGTTCGSSMRMA